MRLEFEIITPMHVQNSIFIGEIFQIEVSDGQVHSLGSGQKVNWYPASVFTGHEFLLNMRLERIIPMAVQNIIFVGEVFQVEISDGLVHPLGVVKM